MDLLTSHSHTGPLSSAKPIPDAFTPKSSPTTLYHEIKSSPLPENQNRASSSSDSVFQIAVALAEVTQLQRPRKPSRTCLLAKDTKFFIWETAFDTLIDSAPISAQHKCISCTNT